ncbi:metallo-beta-lactamase class B [Pseudoduganella lurida]|uniref:Metallo-beta-lactamase class B n=1 Tax=Pseudoduganella lurida TaxID=1036180 RepID=A0A562RKS0_9BURK|nr:subclass B3 metallo-beta-lactamase [Pseudoduganella lurida]TWI69638.1 metallo-beta-lactamase class B [Pseudoduganella lurida]
MKKLMITAMLGVAMFAHAADWDAPQAPFALYGNTYYVGPHGVSSVLVTSPAGHILIDGGTPQSPAAIAASIRKLGFKVEDIKYILSSHEHYDHAGGMAALQKMSGAVVVGSVKSAPVLASGKADKGDPQYGRLDDMAPVARVRAVKEGDVITLGPLQLTAHETPGHTQGGLSWTWQSTENGRTANMVYADSLSALGLNGFRFAGDPRWPTAQQELKATMAKVAAFDCDIIVSAHPEASGLWEKLARQPKLGNAAFLDKEGCRKYVETAKVRLAKQLADEPIQ